MILAKGIAWETSQNDLKSAERDIESRFDTKASQSQMIIADIGDVEIPNLLKQGTCKKL